MAEGHLDDCPSCRRYRRVVDEGVRHLRALPKPGVGEDFRPRLRHRLYHLRDGEVLSDPGSRSSGITAVAAVAVAVVLAAAAWTPVLRTGEGTVTLPAIVVTSPDRRPPRSEVRLPPSAFFRAGGLGAPPRSRWNPPRLLQPSHLGAPTGSTAAWTAAPLTSGTALPVGWIVPPETARAEAGEEAGPPRPGLD